VKKLSFLISALLLIFAFPGVSSSAEWTFMVYLDADNNLEPDAINDINEMETIGSDSNVNIVVLFDRIPGYDSSNGNWTDTRRGLIIKDTDTDTISSTLTSVGEKNMGDGATLTEFTNWAITNYPADKYALILWNHGNGWRTQSDLIKKQISELKAREISARSAVEESWIQSEITKLIEKEQKTQALKEICADDTSNDSLYTSELGVALAAVSTHLDLIGMDACLMQMMEVAYEIKDQGDVFVASEQTEPINGWPYDLIMSDLSADSTMNAAELGQSIATRYGESYNGGYTQSAIKLTEIGNLATALDSLAGAIMASSSEWSSMFQSRSISSSFTDSNYRDLSTFLDEMISKCSDSSVLSAANQAKSAFNSALVYNHSSPAEGGTGLSIYLTNIGKSPVSTYSAANIKFANDTRWDELLNAAASETIPDDKYEPNNNSTEASLLNINSTETGLCLKDEDWFKIYLSSGSRVSIALVHNYYDGDLELDFLDSNKTLLATSVTAENAECVSMEVENEGIYYIRVWGYNSAQNYYYNLHIYDAKLSSIYECAKRPYLFTDYTGHTRVADLSDDDSVNIPIGFNFNFFGTDYSSLNASTNGYITFGLSATIYYNIPMPIPIEPKALIAPLWDDLTPPYGDGGIYYKTTGESGKRKLVISWINYSFYGEFGDVTFQVELNEESGTIRFNYQDVYINDTDFDFGNSATVGILDEDAQKTVLYSYNESVLENEMSLVFKKKAYTPVNSPLWNLY
jgi:cysteine peptidase C11 family protein/pre-peptidase/nidogen-like